LYVGNAIQAFGNGTDVSVWQPMPPVQTTTSITTPSQRAKDREKSPNVIEHNHLNPADNSLYQFCGSLQVSPTIADVDLRVSSMYCGVWCMSPRKCRVIKKKKKKKSLCVCGSCVFADNKYLC